MSNVLGQNQTNWVRHAINRIQTVNKGVVFLASDYLTHMHFSNLKQSLEPTNMLARVALLDILWRTNIQMQPASLDHIARNLSKNTGMIRRVLAGLKEDDLRDNPNKVCDAAAKVLPCILQAKGTKSQHYSFATKFFHWCTRKHFPIMDSLFRKALSRLFPQAIPKEGDKPYAKDYEKWIFLYSDLLKNLSKRNFQRLLKADRNSQKSSLPPVVNSLLRVLDKVFYHWGKEL